MSGEHAKIGWLIYEYSDFGMFDNPRILNVYVKVLIRMELCQRSPTSSGLSMNKRTQFKGHKMHMIRCSADTLPLTSTIHVDL